MIIRADNLDFPEKWDELLESSNGNPIYSYKQLEFYKSISRQQLVKNYSFILTGEDGCPLIGIAAQVFNSPETSDSCVSYFGNPAVLLSSRNVETNTLAFASIQFVNTLTESGFLTELSKSLFTIKVYSDLFSFSNTSLVESIMKFSTSSVSTYERIIDLSNDQNNIYRGLSKSVKAAIKNRDKGNYDSRTLVIDQNSDKVEIELSMQKLRNLHLKSAGRLTRSTQSWEIQEKLINEGSAVLFLGHINDEIVHASYFLRTKTKSYYGVSASQIFKNVSTSHSYIYDAMLYLKAIGINELYMGDQYEDLSRKVDAKTLNISKFKSYFGGKLVSSMIFTKLI